MTIPNAGSMRSEGFGVIGPGAEAGCADARSTLDLALPRALAGATGSAPCKQPNGRIPLLMVRSAKWTARAVKPRVYTGPGYAKFKRGKDSSQEGVQLNRAASQRRSANIAVESAAMAAVVAFASGAPSKRTPGVLGWSVWLTSVAA